MKRPENFGKVDIKKVSSSNEISNISSNYLNHKASDSGYATESQLRQRRKGSRKKIFDKLSTSNDSKDHQNAEKKNASLRTYFRYNRKISFLIGIPFITSFIHIAFKSSTNSSIIASSILPTKASKLLFLMGSLITYISDLTNYRDGVVISIWMTFFSVALSLLSNFIFYEDYTLTNKMNELNSFLYFFISILHLVSSILHLFCFSIWETLQLSSWFLKVSDHKDEEALEFIVMLESVLFGLLPLTFTTSITLTVGLADIVDFLGVEYTSIISYLFALSFSFSLLMLGNQPSSFLIPCTKNTLSTVDHDDNAKYNKINQHQPPRINNGKYPTAIPKQNEPIYALLLVVIPSTIHLIAMRNKLFSFFPSINHIYDYLLTWTISILLLTFLKSSKSLISINNRVTNGSDYIFRQQFMSQTPTKDQNYPNRVDHESFMYHITTLLIFITTKLTHIITLITIFIIHQRHFTKGCSYISLHFHGNAISPSLVSCYLILSYVFIALALHVKKHESTNAFVRSNTKNIFRISIGVAFFFMAMSIGTSIQSTLLYITPPLSIIFFIDSRQQRYMFIFFLFIGIIFSKLTQNDFSFADELLGSRISGLHVAYFSLFATLLLGLTIGIAYRDPSRRFSNITFDVAGILLSCYSITYSFYEITLENANYIQMGSSLSVRQSYFSHLKLVTSALLFIISLHFKQNQAISSGSFLMVSCISVGKLWSSSTLHNKIHIILYITIKSASLFTLAAPYAFLKPLQYTKPKHSNTKTNTSISRMEKTIFNYAVFVLPIAIFFSRKIIIQPIVHLLFPSYIAKHNQVASLPFVWSLGLVVWGFATTSLVTHVLPNEGAENIKKVAVFSLCIGSFATLIVLRVPRYMPTISYSQHISSWGLLVAFLTFLLVLLGPLQLNGRQILSKSKTISTQPSFAKVLTFSFFFGSGIAWFVVFEIIGEVSLTSLILTTTSCMVIAFLGTILSVLGYFLDLKYMSRLQKLIRLVCVVFPMFLIVSALSLWTESPQPNGLGGWLLSYLSVCAIFSVAFTLAMKLRNDELKNQTTQELGNLSCRISWSICIFLVYGQFGLSRLDYSGLWQIFNVPAAIGPVFASMILLLLERRSKDKKTRRNGLSRIISSTKIRDITSSQVSERSRFAEPFASIAIVLFIATLYVITIRGCFNIKLEGIIHTSYEDVFESIFGSSSRATGVLGGHDVAKMVGKKILHSKSITSAAKLAGSGFCTSKTYWGPSLHLISLISVVPSIYNSTMYLWTRKKKPATDVLSVLPLNLLPLLVCNSIPTLQYMSVLGIAGCIFQTMETRQLHYKGRMRI